MTKNGAMSQLTPETEAYIRKMLADKEYYGAANDAIPILLGEVERLREQVEWHEAHRPEDSLAQWKRLHDAEKDRADQIEIDLKSERAVIQMFSHSTAMNIITIGELRGELKKLTDERIAFLGQKAYTHFQEMETAMVKAIPLLVLLSAEKHGGEISRAATRVLEEVRAVLHQRAASTKKEINTDA